MPASSADYHYRTLDDYDRANFAWYTVKIEKPGPRGGKRPPFLWLRFQAANYNEAVEYACSRFLDGCDITVKY